MVRVELQTTGCPPRFLGGPLPGHKLIFNSLIPLKKRKGGGTKKKGELQKQARSLFDFLIARAQNVTCRCEIPHPMKY